MNISREYMIMCSKAKEIQKIKVYRDNIMHFDDGDYYYSNSREKVVIAFDSGDAHSDDFIWLARQDQLQEMCNLTKEGNIYYTLLNFADWIARLGVKEEGKGDINCGSGEQLWLAFIMRRKYNKIWKNNNWINI